MGLIRLLLALSVVFAHSTSLFGYSFVGGEVAVEAFYIISGFYMSLILNEKYIGENKSYRLFITNRFMRLYPIYWTILLLTILFSVFALIMSHGADPIKLKSYLTYHDALNPISFIFLVFTNIFIFFQDLVMFMGIDPSNGNLFFTENFRNTHPTLYSFLFVPQAWTIGIELTFYLLAPFILRKRLWLILLIFLLSISIKILLFKNGLNYDPWTYRFFPAELLFFMLGSIAYRIFRKVKKIKPEQWILLPQLFIVCILIIIFYNLNLAYKDLIFFCIFTFSLPFIFQLTKNWKLDSYIGELSYPIYICHVFIISVIKYFGVKYIQGWLLGILSILLAIILNELIAKKVEKIRQARLAR